MENKKQTAVPAEGGDLTIKSDYISTPVSFIDNVLGSLTRTQTKLFLSIITNVQDKVRRYYDMREKGIAIAETLYDLEEFDEDNRNVKTFEIKLSELAEHACDYNDVRRACFALENILVQSTKIDSHGNVATANIQLCNIYVPQLKRAGYIQAEFRKEVLDIIMNLRSGYLRHRKSIANMSRRDKTTSMYLLLGKEFRKRDCFTMDYEELRRELRLDGVRYKEEGDGSHSGVRITESYSLYKEYRDFKRRILSDTKDELDSLLAEGQCDYSFDFEEVRKDGKRGKLVGIRFRIVRRESVQPVAIEEVIGDIAREQEQMVNARLVDENAAFVDTFRRAYMGDEEALETYRSMCSPITFPKTEEEWRLKASQYGIEI